MATVTSSLIVRLVDAVSGPARAAVASLRNINAATRGVAEHSRAQGAVFSSLTGKVLAFSAAAYGLQRALGSPIKAAMQFESAMADVRKVVDFASNDEFASFQRQIIGMSKTIPMAAQGLAEITAAAGQAGIAREDLMRFTEMAAKVGVAFDITADKAGESLAKMMTGLGMTIPEVNLLADAMNHLSNAQASSAADILDVVRRAGSDGKMFGFTAVQTSAFASAMLSAGAESDVAATSFRNMGRALVRGAAATKSQRAAFRELGLDSVKVAKSMQKDAVGTTIKVLEAINKLPKHEQSATASMLFGDEARALMPLIANMDLLRRSLGLVAEQTRYAGSAAREYEVRSKTFANSVQLFQNRFEGLKIALGNRLMPVMKQLMDFVGPLIDSLANVFDTLDQRVGIFDKVGAAFSGFMKGLGLDGGDAAQGIRSLFDLIFGKLSEFEAGTDRLGDISESFRQLGIAIGSVVEVVSTATGALAAFFGTDVATVVGYAGGIGATAIALTALAAAIKGVGNALLFLTGAKAGLAVLRGAAALAGSATAATTAATAAAAGSASTAAAAAGGVGMSGALAFGALAAGGAYGGYKLGQGASELIGGGTKRWQPKSGEDVQELAARMAEIDAKIADINRRTHPAMRGAPNPELDRLNSDRTSLQQRLDAAPAAARDAAAEMNQAETAAAAGAATGQAYSDNLLKSLREAQAEVNAISAQMQAAMSWTAAPIIAPQVRGLGTDLRGVHADTGVD